MLTKEEIEKKYPGKKLSEIKVLNFYGKNFSNIDIISQMKSLKIVSLSSNKINSLKPFNSLPNLKELFIRNNEIEKIDEIDYLQNCDKLKTLWISENPVCDRKEFKKKLIKKLPKLKNLDDADVIEIKKDIEKKETNNKFTIHEDKLEDLLLDYGQDDNINNKENNNINDKDNDNKQENKDIDNNNKLDNKNNNKMLDSKSDIFKSNIINKEETKIFINKENNKNQDIINNEAEPNYDILNDILKNVDTSQSFIRKNNPNSDIKKIDINNINENDNINNNENMPINNNKNDISLTRNINDLIKEAKLIPNNDNNNNMNNIDSKSNYSEVDKILGEVDTSQTILKKKENENNNEINNILKDVQSSSPEFNEINLNSKPEEKNIASIDDIRKMFNNDLMPPGRISRSNLYGNQNISDTKINSIFKNDMITSESYNRNISNRENNGPYKPDFKIPNHLQNYNYNYDKRMKYEIKPSHENRIRAIKNLMEDLSLENLLLVKNRIISRLNGQK